MEARIVSVTSTSLRYAQVQKVLHAPTPPSDRRKERAGDLPPFGEQRAFAVTRRAGRGRELAMPTDGLRHRTKRTLPMRAHGDSPTERGGASASLGDRGGGGVWPPFGASERSRARAPGPCHRPCEAPRARLRRRAPSHHAARARRAPVAVRGRLRAESGGAPAQRPEAPASAHPGEPRDLRKPPALTARTLAMWALRGIAPHPSLASLGDLWSKW